MALPEFDDLPFNSRPDLTPFLIHLTKNTVAVDKYDAFDNLISMLKGGEIWGSKPSKGMIKGPNKAACFMDVPFSAMKYVLTPENMNPERPRYEPYGIVLTKSWAYRHGGRPVLYLSDKETKDLRIPDEELWRVVRFEETENGWISWLHEREWRFKNRLKLPKSIKAVLVKNTEDANELTNVIADQRAEFKCVPKAIIPLSVITQGFLRPLNNP